MRLYEPDVLIIRLYLYHIVNRKYKSLKCHLVLVFDDDDNFVDIALEDKIRSSTLVLGIQPSARCVYQDEFFPNGLHGSRNIFVQSRMA